MNHATKQDDYHSKTIKDDLWALPGRPRVLFAMYIIEYLERGDTSSPPSSLAQSPEASRRTMSFDTIAMRTLTGVCTQRLERGLPSSGMSNQKALMVQYQDL